MIKINLILLLFCLLFGLGVLNHSGYFNKPVDPMVYPGIAIKYTQEEKFLKWKLRDRSLKRK